MTAPSTRRSPASGPPASKNGTVRRSACLLALGLTLLWPGAALAQEQTAARKLGRGFAGLGLGFLEIPGQVWQETEESNVFLGLTVGLAKGIGGFATRTLVGAYEILTCPFPIPEGFEPIVSPEFS